MISVDYFGSQVRPEHLAQGAFFLSLKFVFASLKAQFSNISRNLALPQFHETSLWQGFRELELSAKCLNSYRVVIARGCQN